ncbi:WD40-repeat-containing domain protein [Fimicolochytrium jonesii]|uniref:WD40-repeat-containing domain protein n=1 Tax=Fimicolochytrium jonesii TaxID=1396493 RepID=UPI0022FF06EC|nr:WD40-repeat-containing domain protein [Fimicolochytrium jonesii]KAI8820544.1 WD40-repeat-containing domain protein [Fimicolochytrium jonesii]
MTVLGFLGLAQFEAQHLPTFRGNQTRNTLKMNGTGSTNFDYCHFFPHSNPVVTCFSPNPETIHLATLHTEKPTLVIHEIQNPDAFSETTTNADTIEAKITYAVALPEVSEALCWAGPELLFVGGRTELRAIKLREEGVQDVIALAPFEKGVGVTKVAFRDADIACVGSKGQIALVNIDGYAKQDIGRETSEITGLQWKGAHELVTSSSAGRITLYDIREDGPGRQLTDQHNPSLSINCLDVHPVLHDKIATGDTTGLVGVWDLRKMDEAAVETLRMHNGQDVWGVKFHPDSPGEIVSCGEDGSICLARWSPDGIDANSITNDRADVLRYQSRRHPLPFNSIDIHAGVNLLAGVGDGGALVLQQL